MFAMHLYTCLGRGMHCRIIFILLEGVATPHPAILGSVLIAGDPNLPKRFFCKFCKGGQGRGTPPGTQARYPNINDLIDHLSRHQIGAN
eukprot:5884085-Amphidinium_carterae.1